MTQEIRIATRKSPLALWQANDVKQRLEAVHKNIVVTLVPMSTRGDKLLDSPLSKIGGKGLFLKELEQALLEGVADIAVHSMKDVPAALPEPFQLGPILPRENPYDAFVSNQYASLDALPQNARVGTCSLRRKAQVLARRPDLEILDLRGNVNSRLEKLDDNHYDAIILAVAGLLRLNFEERIASTIDSDTCLPAVGQGAVGIELRKDDADVASVLHPLECPDTRLRVTAERAFNATLNGGCQAPVAGFAELSDNEITFTGLVASPDGTEVIRETATDTTDNAAVLGAGVARTVLSRGADRILRDAGIEPAPAD